MIQSACSILGACFFANITHEGGMMPAQSSISSSCGFTPGSGDSCATASITLGGPELGKVTVTVYRRQGAPIEYVIEPTDADLADAVNHKPQSGEPGVRTVEQAQILLSLIDSAMTAGGWQRNTGGQGSGTYIHFKPSARK